MSWTIIKMWVNYYKWMCLFHIINKKIWIKYLLFHPIDQVHCKRILGLRPVLKKLLKILERAVKFFMTLKKLDSWGTNINGYANKQSLSSLFKEHFSDYSLEKCQKKLILLYRIWQVQKQDGNSLEESSKILSLE